MLSAVVVIILAVRRRREIRLLLLSYFVGLGIFGLLGFPLFDHYLTGLMPIWAMLTAIVIKRLPKILTIALVIIFLIVNLYQFSRVNNPYGISNKKALVKWANQYLAGTNWALESESKCHRENGLRYLFELSGNPPGQSFMDPNFSWLYPQPPVPEAAERVLLVTDRFYNGGREIIFKQSFGSLDAYILQP